VRKFLKFREENQNIQESLCSAAIPVTIIMVHNPSNYYLCLYYDKEIDLSWETKKESMSSL
jgi:hypothetical protein